ncbi:MAG TPA: ABC transporter permease [Longimicrobiales bacterium]|nr:ABC transporter permease [Longimicrobiales bacterium]
MSPDRLAAPPRLGEAILRWTLPPGVVGTSIKGDLDAEHRALQRSVPGKSFRGWYLGEALKLGARYSVLGLLSVGAPFGRSPGARAPMGFGERFLQEVGHGLRLLWRSPGLALFAVVAMGLGIGATATMFSVSHGLLRDLPFEDPDRLVYVGWSQVGRGDDKIELTASELAAWRQTQSTLEALAAVRMVAVDLAGAEGPPERVSGAQITADAFETLRVQPALGRGFRPEEAAPGGPDVVVLSHGLWARRYGADPEVLGRTLRMNGTERTVVGIMPEGFRFPELEDVWTPLQVAPASEAPVEGPRQYRAFGRLRDGASLDEARTAFGVLARRSMLAHPEPYQGFTSRVIPYYEYYVGADAVIIMITLVVIASFVLLIACATVANLLLSRAAGRSRELAVRSALGASRGRIMAQLLAESLAIAALGGILGAVIAWSGAALFHRTIAGQLPFYWMDCRIDGTVLTFVGLLVVAAGVLAGIAPAVRVSRVEAGVALRDGDRGSSSLRLGRLSRALVVAEVALSFGLLTTAGMMAKGPLIYGRQDPGFESAHMLTGLVSLRRDEYPDASDWSRFFRELLARLDAAPGVQAAALTTSVPGLPANTSRFQLRDAVYEKEEDLPLTRIGFVAPQFIRTLGAEALEGRFFADGDDPDGEAVAVVNRSFAQRFFPGESPLGRQIRTGGLDSQDAWATVVGVVPDLRMNGPKPERPEGILLPLYQRPQRSVDLLLRTSGDPSDLAPLVRAAAAELDPDLPVSQLRTLHAAMADETRPELMFFTLVLICGSIALVLAAVGLFGVLAFSVRRRTREIGVRIALGAEVRSVLWGVLRGGMIQVTVGLAAGLLLALALAPLVRSLFAGDQLMDWSVYGVVTALMLGTGFAASLIPATRAVRVNPVDALRRD